MEYIAHILTMAGLFVILTVSLNLVIGFSGLPAMGQSAFFCVGAYASALMCLQFGLSPWVTIALASGIAAITGWLVSFTASRLIDDLLALATFGFAAIAHSLAVNWTSLTRGPLGLSDIAPIAVLGISLDTPYTFLPVVVVCCLLCIVVVHRLAHSPFGRVIQGMRESSVVITSVGVDVGRYTRTVFAVGAAFAGLAGALYAHYITYIDPASFTPLESVTILLMVVFGGMGSIPGSVLGAVVLVLLPESLRFIGLPSSVAAPVRQVIYGGLLVLLMLTRPSGLLGRYKWQ